METKKEAFKKFVIEQLEDFDYWVEASPEGYAETIVDEAVKLFCQPAIMCELTCDNCGCHPNVIYTTSKGRFCEQCKPSS
jgi:hypothetical protein